MAKVEKGKWCGNWFVLDSMGHGMFWCRCSCGFERVMIGGNLAAKGKSRNCSGHKLRGGVPGAVRSHPLYPTWYSMMGRCYNKGRKDFKHYGAKGIKVCERWHNFDDFVADVGERPEGKQLDRWPDMTGNYGPNNHRWATPKQNSRNRTSSRYITANGVTQTVAEWAELTGMSLQTILQRIDKHGWTEQDAVTIPKAHRSPR